MGSPSGGVCLRFYLSAFTFTILGILGGAAMLLAIVYVPILFAYAGYSDAFETIAKSGALAGLRAALSHACADLPLRTVPAQRNGAG